MKTHNKLKARFMAKGTDEEDVLEHDLKKAGTLDSMHYHDQWDWIMPVVEKIDQLGASVIIGRMFCEIKYIDPLNQSRAFGVRIASGVKINAVNGAVMEFIKWYNANQ